MIEQKSTSASKGDLAGLPLIVESIERELSRLRRLRPELTSRIDRAEHILVTQLSVPAARPVKVRIHADGSRSFTVHSCSRLSLSYTVSSDFHCDCPDSRRRACGVKPPACKHSIACYVLDRVLLKARSVKTSPYRRDTAVSSLCSGCGERVANRDLTEVQDWHESLTYFAGDMLCVECFSGSDCW